MQARITESQSPEHSHYFEICLHHNNFSEWEWLIIPMADHANQNEQIVSLAGPVANWNKAPDTLRTLGSEWTTLTALDCEWVRTTLFAPLIEHLKIHMDRVSDVATLCSSLARFYPAMNGMLEQAERDYVFTATTSIHLSARWRRHYLSDSHPVHDTPLALDLSILQIFTQDGETLLMQCGIERWRDGLYWIWNLEEDTMGAFIPGLMVAYLDCLPAGSLSQDDAPLAPRPECLQPDLQSWLIATILWPDEIHPDPAHVIEHIRERAAELSPSSIGRSGTQYSKRLAVARVIEERSVEDILNEFTSFD